VSGRRSTGQREQIGAGLRARIVAAVLENVVDQAIQPLPAGLGIDGDDGRADTHGPRDNRFGGFLDEDRGRSAVRGGLTVDPAGRIGLADSEQKEDIGGPGADRQPQPDVVGVDQRRRPHRHVQAPWRLHKPDQRRIQG
jgi:hypothetical protein